MSDLLSWIWFASRPGLRGETRRMLLDHFGEPGAVFAAGEAALKACGLGGPELAALLDRDTGEAGRILSRCDETDCAVLTMQDAAYPQRLRAIDDPPCVLYVKGKLPPVDAEAVLAVVGTRKCTPYGEKMSRNLGYGIARGGGIVVTGLAAGADSYAAEGALMAGGRVIGVLGTAINIVYPAWNGPLYDDVLATGAIVSEYPPDAEGNRAYFPARNRIMAGLSLGVVVTEAPARSGSLITASRAADYGRDVFAVPGNADYPNSRGCNALIRDGAKLVENARDVLSEYERRFPDQLDTGRPLGLPAGRAVPDRQARLKDEAEAKRKLHPGEQAPEKQENTGEEGTKPGFFKLRVPNRRTRQEGQDSNPSGLAGQLSGLNETQLRIVGVMDKPDMHIDDIIELTQLPAAAVLSEMTLLQIKGYVTAGSGKRFSLNIKKG